MSDVLSITSWDTSRAFADRFGCLQGRVIVKVNGKKYTSKIYIKIYRLTWSFFGGHNTLESIKLLVVVIILVLRLNVQRILTDLDAPLVYMCDQLKSLFLWTWRTFDAHCLGVVGCVMQLTSALVQCLASVLHQLVFIRQTNPNWDS